MKWIISVMFLSTTNSNTYTAPTSLKQTKHRGAASAAVGKAHGAVIDIAAAPGQSSPTRQHGFVGLLGYLASARRSHMSRALVRDTKCCDIIL